jgi:hypothetical protein
MMQFALGETMRLALPGLAAMCLSLTACGGEAKDGGSQPMTASGAVGAVTHIAAHAARSAAYGDGDRDSPADSSAGGASHDSDDATVTGYGHAASARDAREITALVQRYYAAAAAEDGARACGLTYYILAESIPEDYGRPPGPRYLSGAGTCQAVLSIVFKRFHVQLAEPPRVRAVRVNGTLAYALLDWTTLPAGYIEARREGGTWKIDRVLAAPLP